MYGIDSRRQTLRALVIRPYSGPTTSEVRRALSAIVTHGLVPYHVAESGGPLLSLEIVQSRLPPNLNGDEEKRDAAYTEALRSVLHEAVMERVLTRRHRRLLRYVLPLIPEYLGTTVLERRTLAGEQMRDGIKSVKAGTIRTYYEPRALDQLAAALVAMEAEHRGEDISLPATPGEDGAATALSRS
jgi:hypothetical protein